MSPGNSLVALFALLASLAIWTSFSSLQLDQDTCIVPRMWVAYAPLPELTQHHSRLAHKYSLYLVKSTPYEIPVPVRPAGIPVLFVPGNAGSYRQIRSISDTCRELQETYGGPEIDFFALDFNEAYSALHGRTLLDQAEYLNDAVKYIIDLYKENGHHRPTVAVLGHSMGGIVSRLALSLDNYTPETVDTIFTLASPHLTPPATFDGDIQKVYNRMNDFWRENKDGLLTNITVLSIAGGKRDSMVPSDYVSLDSIVPSSNGLSTFSNSVNRVWTGIDHDAMMWCHQLRSRVAEALMTIVGKKGVDEKMQVLRKVFSGTQTLGSEVGGVEVDHVRELIPGLRQNLGSGFYFAQKVQIMTSHRVNHETPYEDFELNSGAHMTAYECATKEGSFFTGCRKIHPLLVPEGDRTLAYIKTEKFLLLQVEQGEDWISVDHVTEKVVETDFFAKTSVTVDNIVSTDLVLPAVTSGLLSYKVSVSRDIHVIRQYVEHQGSRVYDSKYLVPQSGSVDVSFHGEAPYVPASKPAPLHLQVFGEGHVTIEVDWMGSLGNLFMRYRILFISLPSSILYAILLVMFHTRDDTGKFVSLREATSMFINRYLLLACVSGSGLAYLTGFSQVRDTLHLVQIPITKTFAVGDEYTVNDLFLGVSGVLGAVLASVFIVFSTGVVVIVSEVVTGLTFLLSFSFRNKTPVTKTALDPSSNNPITDLLHKRTVFVALISVLVLLFFPYQLAFTLATISLLIMTSYFKSNTSPSEQSFNNYITAVCVLMTWTSLVNAPVLAVWIQGIVVQRNMSFSSHHNLVSILPTLLFVENLSFKRTPSSSTITSLLLAYTALHTLIYGTMQTFMIHHGFNLLAAWLLCMSYKRVFFKSKQE